MPAARSGGGRRCDAAGACAEQDAAAAATPSEASRPPTTVRLSSVGTDGAGLRPERRNAGHRGCSQRREDAADCVSPA